MKKSYSTFLLFVIVLLLSSCGSNSNVKNEKLLADFIDLNGIEKAEVHNNYGKFLLNKTQLDGDTEVDNYNLVGIPTSCQERRIYPKPRNECTAISDS
ncbi:MAG: hypothetical protein EOO07_36495 [Chitinophagaceae bacterium]|nr:MAG: hypothetical protein EOO07_36495 [Chitinophagaceae bacterium]